MHTVKSFNFMEANFRGLLVFWLIRGYVISWMRQFLVSEKKITLSKKNFVDDVNSWGRVTHEYHEN